jgi:hypothetical protein
MEWGEHSVSLIDLRNLDNSADGGSCSESGSKLASHTHSSQQLAPNTSLPPSQTHQQRGEEDLFAHGSPICGVSDDPAILDIDSDGGEPSNSDTVDSQDIKHMCIDSNCGSRIEDPDATASPSRGRYPGVR